MMDAAPAVTTGGRVRFSNRNTGTEVQEKKYRNKDTGIDIQEHRYRVRYRNIDSEEIQ